MNVVNSKLLTISHQVALKSLNKVTIRCLATHWNPRFRRLRGEKTVKIDLPDFNKLRGDMQLSIEERRSKNKKEGIQPPISFEYKPFNITASNEIFDPYVPPEGDGRRTILSKEGINQRFLALKSKGTVWRHIRKIQQYQESFSSEYFTDESKRLFIEAHEALANRDSERLIELVTEHCYPKMWFQNRYKTIRWKWIEEIEPPEIVHAVTRELESKRNIYGQVTVRMHSKQTLAIYDRFGRLAYGDEKLVKNVLEYLVFEKPLTNQYGVWRLHDKIIPPWTEAKMPIIRTYVKPKPIKVDEDVGDDLVKKAKFKKDDSHLEDIKKEPENENKPSLA